MDAHERAMDMTGIKAHLTSMTHDDAHEGQRTPPKPLPAAAERALAEAAQRRAERERARPAPNPKEIGGPKGPEPTRYGDWEKKGLTSDF